MVDVESSDATANRNADAVIAAHRVGNKRGLEICKGAEVIDPGSVTVRRVIRHLGLLTVSLFKFPDTKPAGGLQLRRDVFDIHHSGQTSFLVEFVPCVEARIANCFVTAASISYFF